jgi:glycosyltransferase involved in cell wall biosynthesis
MESPFLLPYLHAIRETTDAPVVLRSLNVEFRIWEQLAANENNVFRRRLYAHIARTLRRYEIERLDACDAIVPITAEDAQLFRDLGCTRPMHVLPGGVENLGVRWQSHRPGTRAATGVAALLDHRSAYFLGSLDYRPNQEAALWIAQQLRPRLGHDVQLHVGGSNAPPSLGARLAVEGVSLATDVRDAAAFAAPMAVMIAPLFAGGGMRIKILEAMALGKPVVSTTIGAAGIGVTDGVNIRLADDADAFAAAVTELLDSPSRARAIGDAGRRFVIERYATDVLAHELLAFYEQLTQRRGVSSGR